MLVPLTASQLLAQTLDSFAVLAGSAVTDAGSSVITGNVGVSPGASITGFPPGIVNAPYTIYNNDAVAAGAQSQLTTAYNVLAGRASTASLTGQDLGGQTLSGGVYSFANSAQLTGTLTLDGQGDPNTVFVFNIGSTLTTASASRIVLINNADPNKVFFRVGSSATLGGNTQFVGKILALSSITLITGATIDCGAALARNAGVTLDSNVINVCTTNAVIIGQPTVPPVSGTPTPGTPTPTPTAGTGATEADIIEAINNYVGDDTILPLGFAVLALLSPDELDDAIDQLAGEVATATTPVAIQSMNSFLNLVNRRTGAPVGSLGNPETAFGPQTISVMGYAASPSAPAAFTDFDKRPMPNIAEWEIWSAVYGGRTETSGDDADSSNDRTISDYGLAFGFERHPTTDTMFGLAVSGGGTNFDIDDTLGSGKSAMLQAALYARADSDRAYVSGALAYGIHDMHTDRAIDFAGLDQFTGDFYTQTVAADLEIGYKAGFLTPFAAVRGQAIATPGYEEETVSGASTFALGYEDRLELAGRIEIGARADWTTELEAGSLTAFTSLSLAHQLTSDNTVDAYFLALPGSRFQVRGAEAHANSVLASAGLEMQFDRGLSLSGGVDGSWSGNALSYSGYARVGHRW